MRSTTIRAVCRALARDYGNPRLGNKSNPLDELVYIVLSTRTQDQTFRVAFANLKAEFRSWSRVGSRDRNRIESDR
jgi:endonuclease III